MNKLITGIAGVIMLIGVSSTSVSAGPDFQLHIGKGGVSIHVDKHRHYRHRDYRPRHRHYRPRERCKTVFYDSPYGSFGQVECRTPRQWRRYY